jgi:hypothetical protein
MSKSRLLQAVCTVAMLAAAPAFAQNTPAGTTEPNGAANATQHQAMPNGGAMSDNGGGMNGGSMEPPNKMGSAVGTTSSMASESHSTHRSAMAHANRAMRGQTDSSQDAAVNHLNDQSYQAAEKGQAFSANGSDTTPAAAMPPSGPASTNGTSGGSTPSMAGSTGDSHKQP